MNISIAEFFNPTGVGAIPSTEVRAQFTGSIFSIVSTNSSISKSEAVLLSDNQLYFAVDSARLSAVDIVDTLVTFSASASVSEKVIYADASATITSTQVATLIGHILTGIYPAANKVYAIASVSGIVEASAERPQSIAGTGSITFSTSSTEAELQHVVGATNAICEFSIPGVTATIDRSALEVLATAIGNVRLTSARPNPLILYTSVINGLTTTAPQISIRVYALGVVI
jgi:hypothetical protein